MQYANLMTVESPAADVTQRRGSLRARLGGAGVVLAAALLSACSGGSGADVEQNPGIATQGLTSNYNGPPPTTEDVQSFKINLWDNVQANNRCGTCHSDTGGQAPMFARRDDINLAYAAANGVVTLPSPKDSRMVAKVGGGHNCWLAAASACADTMTVWIRNWAGASATGGKQIELKEPTIKEVGASKTFPSDSAKFQQSRLWNDPANAPGMLRKYCARCHSSSLAARTS